MREYANFGANVTIMRKVAENVVFWMTLSHPPFSFPLPNIPFPSSFPSSLLLSHFLFSRHSSASLTLLAGSYISISVPFTY